MADIDIIVNSDPPEISARLWQGWQGTTAYYVGANCGQNFDQLLRLGFRQIVAFEPDTRSCAVARSLAAKLATNPAALPAGRHVHIDVLNLAVSDYNGHLDLARLLDTPQDRTGQLVTYGHSGMEWDPGKDAWLNLDKVQPVTVRCAPLDDLTDTFTPPDFVVIDTEGHESLVMQGAGRVLTEVKPGWLIEFHSPDNYDTVRRFFDSHGYMTETVRHPHYPPHTKMWYQHGWLKARPLRGL